MTPNWPVWHPRPQLLFQLVSLLIAQSPLAGRWRASWLLWCFSAGPVRLLLQALKISVINGIHQRPFTVKEFLRHPVCVNIWYRRLPHWAGFEHSKTSITLHLICLDYTEIDIQILENFCHCYCFHLWHNWWNKTYILWRMLQNALNCWHLTPLMTEFIRVDSSQNRTTIWPSFYVTFF